MQNEELFKEIDDTQDFTQKYLGLSLTKFSILLLMVLVFGVYIGTVLYGTNSLEILFGLQDYEIYLQDEIIQLKHENAELQREYFELKEITAQ